MASGAGCRQESSVPCHVDPHRADLSVLMTKSALRETGGSYNTFYGRTSEVTLSFLLNPIDQRGQPYSLWEGTTEGRRQDSSEAILKAGSYSTTAGQLWTGVNLCGMLTLSGAWYNLISESWAGDAEWFWTILGQFCSWSCQSPEGPETLTPVWGSSFLGQREAYRPNGFPLANNLLCGFGEWDGQNSKVTPKISAPWST